MQIDLPLIKKFFSQMLDILSEFEQSKIIHRDIKPDNILIDKKCNFKIADLGLSKQIQNEQEGILMTGFGMGTRGFIPPEFYDKTSIKTKGDIWSTGLTLYYLCSLQHPNKHFESYLNEGNYYDHIPQLKGKYQEYFNNIYSKMVIKDPDKRSKASDLKKLFQSDAKIKSISDLDESKILIPTSISKIADEFNLAFNEGNFNQCKGILSMIEKDDFLIKFKNHYDILHAKLCFFEGQYYESNILLQKYELCYFDEFPDFMFEYYRMKIELNLILGLNNEDSKVTKTLDECINNASYSMIKTSKLIDLRRLLIEEPELLELSKSKSNNYKEALMKFDQNVNTAIKQPKIVPKIEIVRMKYILANLYQKEKNYDKAFQLYLESIENLNGIEKIYNPIAVKAHFYYGKFILSLMKDEEYNESNSKFNEAISHFKKAIEIFGNSQSIKFYEPFVMLGKCFLKSGLFGKYFKFMSEDFKNILVKITDVNHSIIMRNEYSNFLFIFRNYKTSMNILSDLYTTLLSSNDPYFKENNKIRYILILLNNKLITNANHEIYIKDKKFPETIQIFNELLNFLSTKEDLSKMMDENETNSIIPQVINNCINVCCIIKHEGKFTEINQQIENIFGNKNNQEFVIQYANWYIQKQEFHFADEILDHLDLSNCGNNLELIYHFSYLRALEYFISKNYIKALNFFKISEAISVMIPSFPLFSKYEFYFNYCLANLNNHLFSEAQNIFMQMKLIFNDLESRIKIDVNDPFVIEYYHIGQLLNCLSSNI